MFNWFFCNCSENFKYYEELDSCEKELVWYDNQDFAQGINYASGFKNRMRINAAFQNPTYVKSDFSKSLNGDVTFINSYDELNDITPIGEEFIFDFIKKRFLKEITDYYDFWVNECDE